MLTPLKLKTCRPALMLGFLVLGGTVFYSLPATAQNDSVTPAAGAAADNVAVTNPTYLHDIQPLFLGLCARCHNSSSRYLPDWTDYKIAYAHREEIERRVWYSWKGDYYKQAMPAGDCPEMRRMTEADRAIIKRWVDDGAPLGVAQKFTGHETKADRIRMGRRLFNSMCAACHQHAGQGVANKYPPLAGSDFLNANKDRAIMVLLYGRTGEIVVNGKKYDNTMPKFPLDDASIASALTYVYNSFGNSGKDVTPQEVEALRAKPAPPTAAKPASESKSSIFQ